MCWQCPASNFYLFLIVNGNFFPKHTYLHEKVYVSSALIQQELQQKDNHHTNLFFVSCSVLLDMPWRTPLRVLCEKAQTIRLGGLVVDYISKSSPVLEMAEAT